MSDCGKAHLLSCRGCSVPFFSQGCGKPITLLSGHTFCQKCVDANKYDLAKESDDTTNDLVNTFALVAITKKSELDQLKQLISANAVTGRETIVAKTAIVPRAPGDLGNWARSRLILQFEGGGYAVVDRGVDEEQRQEMSEQDREMLYGASENVVLAEIQKKIARAILDKQGVRDVGASVSASASSSRSPSKGDVAKYSSSDSEFVISTLRDKCRDEFDCPICSDLLFEPTVLPCGHCLCRPCLVRTLDHAWDKPPTCPLCRSNLGGYLLWLNTQAQQANDTSVEEMFSHGARHVSVCHLLEKVLLLSFPVEYLQHKQSLFSDELEADVMPITPEARPAVPAPKRRKTSHEDDTDSKYNTGTDTDSKCNSISEPAPSEVALSRAGSRTSSAFVRPHVPIFVCNMAVPGVESSLNIFEPRYRLMMRRCIESGQRCFGMHPGLEWDSFRVILGSQEANAELQRLSEMSESEQTKGDKNLSPYGTLLRINEFEQRPDGSSKIGTMGVRRFKVLKWGEKDNYLTGEVQWVRDMPYSGPPMLGVEIGPQSRRPEEGTTSSSSGDAAVRPDFSPDIPRAEPRSSLKLQMFDMSDNSIPDFSPAAASRSPRRTLTPPPGSNMPNFRTAESLVQVEWRALFRRDAIWTMRAARRRWASYDTIFALTGRGMIKLSNLVLDQQGKPPDILKPLRYTRVHKEPIPVLFSDGAAGEGGSTDIEVSEDVEETGREESVDLQMLVELERAPPPIPQPVTGGSAAAAPSPRSPGSEGYHTAAEESSSETDPLKVAETQWETDICIPMVTEALDCQLALRDDAINTISRAVFWMYHAESVGGHVTDAEVYKILFGPDTRQSLWARISILKDHLRGVLREADDEDGPVGKGGGKGGKGKGYKGLGCPVQ